MPASLPFALGSVRVADGVEYGRPGVFVVECFDYWNMRHEPSWAVPAWLWLEDDYPTREAAEAALADRVW